MPTFMGVLVSPAARRTVPKMIVAARKSMGVYRMKKYRLAVGRMAGSTCIHTGITPLRPRVTAVNTTPAAAVTITAWAEAFAAACLSPAPHALAIKDRKPTPQALTMPPMSQPTVVVAPTAAIASVPRLPTMAVSMYCTAVCISCSSMVGQARARITPIICLSRCLNQFRMSYLILWDQIILSYLSRFFAGCQHSSCILLAF